MKTKFTQTTIYGRTAETIQAIRSKYELKGERLSRPTIIAMGVNALAESLRIPVGESPAKGAENG